MSIEPLRHDPTGVAAWLDREAKALPLYHWSRELLQNALDAGATEVVFDAYTDANGRRLARCSDNGQGMTAEELTKHGQTLHLSGTNREDNYGVGGRLASLNFNPSGVVWASRAIDEVHDDVFDCQVMLKRERGIYGIKLWQFSDGSRDRVANPDDDMLDQIGEDSGTAVILCGTGHNSTWDSKVAFGVDMYLTRRYFTMGDARVLINDEKKSHRVVPYGEQLDRTSVASGIVPVDEEGSIAQWWLLHPVSDRVQPKSGATVASISALTSNELFDMTLAGDRRARYGQFGIVTKAAKTRVAVVVIPGFEVGMTTGRAGLVRAGGEPLPWEGWGERFYEQMPDEIRALMANTSQDAKLDPRWLKDLDPEWFKLINATPIRIPDPDGELVNLVARLKETTGAPPEITIGPPHEPPCTPPGPPLPPRPRITSEDDGSERGRKGTTHQLPECDFQTNDEWTEDSSKFAYYNRVSNTIFIREEAFLFDAAVGRFVQEFALVEPKLLHDFVLHGYATEATANVLHVLTMKKQGWLPDEVDYALSAAGLSAALLGMHSIDRHIRDRCRDLTRGLRD